MYGEFNYHCSGCKKEFISNVKLFNKFKYCSDVCKCEYGNLKFVNCEICTKVLRKDKSSKTKIFFCGMPCYRKWQSENVTPPQTELRKINANSPEAIAKRTKTNIEKGVWVDKTIFVEGLSFKYYVKLVRQLTIKMRKEVYGTWDGYDHYDGEYIKENSSLPFTHGDYPSIDHKISCTEGFLKKMAPIELCTIDNLVITKKRINASKNNKDYFKFKQLLNET